MRAISVDITSNINLGSKLATLALLNVLVTLFVARTHEGLLVTQQILRGPHIVCRFVSIGMVRTYINQYQTDSDGEALVLDEVRRHFAQAQHALRPR